MTKTSDILPLPKGLPLAGNDTVVVYKHSPQGELELHCLRATAPGNHPTAVFFYGGGWKGGTVTHLLRQALHFNRRGMTSILVDYRVASRHGTTPVEAVQDARSAMRFIKAHGSELNVNPHKVAAVGASAGGHLALCTALAGTINDPRDNLEIDPKPNALVGINAVLDTSPPGYGHEQFPGDSAARACPVDLVEPGMPPVLLLHGNDDQTVPVDQARRFKEVAHQADVNCKLVEYDHRDHAFFNDGQDFFATLTEIDLFFVACELIAAA